MLGICAKRIHVVATGRLKERLRLQTTVVCAGLLPRTRAQQRKQQEREVQVRSRFKYHGIIRSGDETRPDNGGSPHQRHGSGESSQGALCPGRVSKRIVYIRYGTEMKSLKRGIPFS